MSSGASPPEDSAGHAGSEARGAVVITGAGRGIGRAVARRLAEAGFPLVLLSKSREHLEETRALCAPFVATRSLVADVREEEQVRQLHPLLNNLPRLHAVVNNAGMGRWSPFAETSLASWNEQVETNLRGPFLVIRETLDYFLRQGSGLYVNVGSDCSLVGMAQRSAYNASKFGLVGLTASLRAEVQARGVHASVVYAGKTDTYFRDHQPGDRPDALHAGDVADAIAFVVTRYPRVVIGEISLFPPAGGLDGPRSLL